MPPVFLCFSRKPHNPKKLELAGAGYTRELFDCKLPAMNFTAERLTPKAIGIEGAQESTIMRAFMEMQTADCSFQDDP